MSNRPDPATINEPQLFGNYETPMLPIRYAVDQVDPALLQSFIDTGADVNIDIGGGMTPLHLAVGFYIDEMTHTGRETFSDKEQEIFNILLRSGADLNKTNKEGQKPLDVINEFAFSKEGFSELLDLFRPIIPNIDELVTYIG
ncbi:hypothetical protein [Niastella yeongjuensis]|nr:hypothetical protein [Niastella yeongjuensis]SEP19032.1 Ankyrin repeat-containing protein [Niastella yeongjuensis]